MQQNVEKYWNKVNSKYDLNWNKTKARKIMSEKEKGFISKYLSRFKGNKILDIGVGSGRILEELVKNSNDNVEIYGIDVASEMVAVCQNKFAGIKKIVKLKQTDISNEEINLGTFNFITAVRILKYTKNWQDTMGKIENLLENNGILIFTIPNKFSINFFHKGPLPLQRTSLKELKSALAKKNLKILEMRSFSKLPDVFYDNRLANNKFFIKLLFGAERVLDILFGNLVFGRIIFTAVKK